MLEVVIDTNVLYEGRRLRAVKERGTCRFWGSAANLIELVADVVDDSSLRKTQSRLTTLLDVCEPELLPGFDQFVLQQLGFTANLADARFWRDQVVPRLLRAQSFQGLDVDVQRARDRREQHRQDFESAATQVIRGVLPNADVTERGWRVQAPPGELPRIRKELWSLEKGIQLLLKFRVGPYLSPEEAEGIDHERLARVARPYFCGFRGWLLKTFQDGRKPRGNDAIDLFFLLPLSQEGWVLLTQERHLREILEAGEFDLGRLRSLEELEA